MLTYAFMEGTALWPRRRAQLRHLLWRELYKHELCEMDSFHRCSLSMHPDYNSQLSIHIYLIINSNYPVSFFFLLLLLFSCHHAYLDNPSPLEESELLKILVIVFVTFMILPHFPGLKLFLLTFCLFFFSLLQFVQCCLYGSNFMDESLPLGVTEYM